MNIGDAMRCVMLACILGVFPGTSGHAQQPAAAGPACNVALGVASLQSFTCGSLARAHVIGEVILAGQPAPADLDALRAAGVHTVINLRGPGEIDWDEGAVVRSLGMQYLNPGFSATEQLTDTVFESVRSALRASKGKPVLMHCASANRVGAVWLAHRVLDGGLDLQSALQEARTAGLRSPELEARARAYISRQSP
jgi:uncharacterized protein (TIGR01244 family)